MAERGCSQKYWYIDPQLKEPKTAWCCLHIFTYLQLIQQGEETPINKRLNATWQSEVMVETKWVHSRHNSHRIGANDVSAEPVGNLERELEMKK